MTPLHLLLIRHAESEKNTAGHFSSWSESEPLTRSGERSASRLGVFLSKFAAKKALSVRAVYCTRSVRAVSTAECVAEHLGTEVHSYTALRSTGAGALKGVPEAEAATTHPDFWRELQLYRAGLFDAYHFTVAEGHEDKRAFERRVAGCIEEILTAPGEDLKIVIAHRSSITATLIRIARDSIGYPRTFYGYVQIDLGKVSWLERNRSGDWCIHAVNLDPSNLSLIASTLVT